MKMKYFVVFSLRKAGGRNKAKKELGKEKGTNFH